jgi:glyoxylase-like metal-dependent hydrolase (beta-lactamase superfamily II)
MITVKSFTFNPFLENTYVLADLEGGTCWIVDPGCYSNAERQELDDYLSRESLTPEHLINTHCHIDHIFGNAWVHRRYGLKPMLHREEMPVLEAVESIGAMYGLPVDPSPLPGEFLKEGQELTLGGEVVQVLFTPGHSPGEICLYCPSQHLLIAGDVLFQGSIGRTDLPGGDYDTLLQSIEEKLLDLPDETKVYSGHGPETTIGAERKHNPFLGDLMTKQ